MEFTDYYAETTVSSSTASSVGNGVGKGAAAKSVQTTALTINPLSATAGVMLAWGAITGVINFRRYKKGTITKKQAITATASESVGMGLAAGLGLLADGIVKTSIIASAFPIALPFVVGVVVTTGAKITWDCKTKKNMVWCDRKGSEKACGNSGTALASA